MTTWEEIRSMLTVLSRIFWRSPVTIVMCWFCLALGLTEVIVGISVGTALQRQLSYGDLSEVKIVLRNGSPHELSSTLDNEEVEQLRALCRQPGCRFSPQALIQAASPTGRSGFGIVVRGVESVTGVPGARLTLTQGRFPQPGADELVAGEDALAAAGLHLMDSLPIRGRLFTIVGSYKADGAPLAGEMIGLADQVRSVAGNNWSTIWIGGNAAVTPAADSIQDLLRDAVTVVPASTHFLNEFRKLRSMVNGMVVTITVFVVVFATAAYVSSVGNVVRRAWRNLSILHLLGFRLSSLRIGLAVNGLAIGLLAGLAAVLGSFLILKGLTVGLPVGARTIIISVDLASFAIIVAVGMSMAVGALGAVAAGWRFGKA